MKTKLFMIALVAFVFASCGQQTNTQTSSEVADLETEFATFSEELSAWQASLQSECEAVAAFDLTADEYSLEANVDFLNEEDRARFAESLETIRTSQTQCATLTEASEFTLSEVANFRNAVAELAASGKTGEELASELETLKESLWFVREQFQGWQVAWATLTEAHTPAVESARAYATEVQSKK